MKINADLKKLPHFIFICTKTFSWQYCQWNPAGRVQVLVMVLHPLLSPLCYLLQVFLKVLRSVAGQLVDNILTIRLHGLFIDSLEDFALHVVLQLLPCVTSVSHTVGRQTTKQFNHVAYVTTAEAQKSRRNSGINTIWTSQKKHVGMMLCSWNAPARGMKPSERQNKIALHTSITETYSVESQDLTFTM